MDPDGAYEKKSSNISRASSIDARRSISTAAAAGTKERGKEETEDVIDDIQNKIISDPGGIVDCKKVVVEADKPGASSSLVCGREEDIDCAGVPSAPPLLPPEEDDGEDIVVPPATLDNNMSIIPPPKSGSVVLPLTTAATTTGAKPVGLYAANNDLPVASAVPVINDASALSNNDGTSIVRVGVGNARVLPVPNDINRLNRPTSTSTDYQRNDLESNDIPQEQHDKIPENACVISKTKMFLILIIIITAVAAGGVTLAMVMNNDDNKDDVVDDGLTSDQIVKLLYPNCHVDHPSWIGDGTCNGGPYASSACGWDGGDCPPRDTVDSADKGVEEDSRDDDVNVANEEEEEEVVKEENIRIGEQQPDSPSKNLPQTQTQTPKQPEPEPTVPPKDPEPGPVIVDTCHLPTRTGPFSLGDCKWQGLQASDGSEMAKFGHSVEIDGVWVAVAAHGTVYMFRKSGGRDWSYHQKITVAGYSGDEYTFYSVLSGDTLVFGVKRADIRGEDSGAAFVYQYDSNRDRWVQETMLAPSDGKQGDVFGNIVALYKDRLLVGARQRDHNGIADAGVVYAYYRVNGSWGGQQKIAPNNARAGDEFGARIAFSGDGNTAVITAHKRNVRGTASGAAYAFTYSQARHKWEQTQMIIPGDGQARAEFGSSVALDADGTTMAIAAEYDRDEKGAVYIFTRPGSLWLQKTKLASSSASAGYHFGRSIALHNGALLVGSLKSADSESKHTGGVSLYTGSTNNWRLNKFIESPSGDDRDQFGNKIAMDKNCPNTNTAVIGARYDSSQGKRSGKAYVVALC